MEKSKPVDEPHMCSAYYWNASGIRQDSQVEVGSADPKRGSRVLEENRARVGRHADMALFPHACAQVGFRAPPRGFPEPQTGIPGA